MIFQRARKRTDLRFNQIRFYEEIERLKNHDWSDALLDERCLSAQESLSTCFGKTGEMVNLPAGNPRHDPGRKKIRHRGAN